ncbi:hypothetical protein K435DRAFT_808354 [Dendrothele bispora CBS 962.96]|nr:hypothetical protein K435DRAFT_808354 [Dendrothele bispora CBS 962.96]
MTILGTQIERTYGSASHHQKRNFGNDPITSSIPPTEQTSGVVEEEEESPDTGANIAEAAQTNGTDLIPTFDEITQQIMVDHNDSLDGHDLDTEDNDVPVSSEDSYLLKNLFHFPTSSQSQAPMRYICKLFHTQEANHGNHLLDLGLTHGQMAWVNIADPPLTHGSSVNDLVSHIPA